MAAAREKQRVDEAMLRERRAAAEPELHVDEAAVEAGIVRDQHAVADELGKGVDDLLEARLAAQELVGQAVHRAPPRRRPAGAD